MQTAESPRDASLVTNWTCSSIDPVLYGSRKVENIPFGGATCLETTRTTIVSNYSQRVGAQALIWAKRETGETESCHLRYEIYSFSEA
ncbi:unnamed protein product [Linum trigynum]|uniref:Uncharacterized protein n=1 Tax=Linum trigynum TaxID=586398 RepID=A0AAV2FTM4_9ROSI